MNSRARNVGPYKWIKSKLSSQTSFSSTLEEKHQPLLALCLIFATLTSLFRYVPPAQAREHGFHIACKAEIHMMKRYSDSGEENIYFPVHRYCVLSFAKLSVGATFTMQCISSFFFPQKVLCSSLYRKLYVLY